MTRNNKTKSNIGGFVPEEIQFGNLSGRREFV